ncbi:16S rRNA (guanine(966)-N(2))-methyltransferase RsmD [Candidatus Pelagibacter sp.]|nr:16S rRNA (guanine(966)-N(2))-methyltransferase RsmD [Candidatus Pelagibacter sp.]
MRIISGSFKGKKILTPKDKTTRPLKDLTKESIFNIIKHSNKFEINFSDAIVLDLFCGVGSFGIECLSRGVKKVIFVENYPGVLNILKKNLLNLKSIKNYEVIEKNIYDTEVFSHLKSKFDIIFLDPPYIDKDFKNLFYEIHKYKMLNKGGIVILHRHKKENDFIPSNFDLVEKKIYGISKIIFLSFSN